MSVMTRDCQQSQQIAANVYSKLSQFNSSTSAILFSMSILFIFFMSIIITL